MTLKCKALKHYQMLTRYQSIWMGYSLDCITEVFCSTEKCLEGDLASLKWNTKIHATCQKRAPLHVFTFWWWMGEWSKPLCVTDVHLSNLMRVNTTLCWFRVSRPHSSWIKCGVLGIEDQNNSKDHILKCQANFSCSSAYPRMLTVQTAKLTGTSRFSFIHDITCFVKFILATFSFFCCELLH